MQDKQQENWRGVERTQWGKKAAWSSHKKNILKNHPSHQFITNGPTLPSFVQAKTFYLNHPSPN